MEVKRLRTLNTIHLKLPPFPPRPRAKLYFVQPCTLYQYRFEGGGEGYLGGLFEASELLQKWILCYICILDMLELEGRFL